MLGWNSAPTRHALAAALLWGATAASARAQAPASELPERPLTPVGEPAPALGPSPGAGSSPFAIDPGADAPVLSGRAGPSVPRMPVSATQPGGGATAPAPRAIQPPARQAPGESLFYGTLALPEGGADDDGPPDGLTLDQAIDRLVRENLELRSKAFEIPQAQADILTASLRANPILYADTQMVPYGNFSPNRPGGPTQYDLNITLPLDLNGKRRARIDVACRARRVLEAQYQDAVRVQIDNLYTAFVDVLAARETLRFARASVQGLDRLAEVTRELKQRGNRTQPEVQQVEIQRQSAAIALGEAEAGVRRAKRTLGTLLQLPPGSATGLELRGTLRPVPVGLPPMDELGRMALGSRPDIAAYRLGTDRATADLRLARANRYSDVFLMVQPYTFQDNSPFSTGSAHSWAMGVTVPVPVFNRNQGNIERARLNIDQTRTELATLQQAVLTEVEQVEEEYRVARDATARIEAELLPAATKMLSDTDQIYREGETDLVAFLTAQRNYNDVVRQYRDALVRQRRAALRLNTTVGCRLLP